MSIIRLKSKGIGNLSWLKLQYWDISFFFLESGYPVGVKVPTETEIEWLITPGEDEKTIIEMTMSSDNCNDWSIITIPCPNHFLNHDLYFVGHLDSDNIHQDIENVWPLLTDQLTDSFVKLGIAPAPNTKGDLKMVIINLNQKDDTPMEIETMTDAS